MSDSIEEPRWLAILARAAIVALIVSFVAVIGIGFLHENKVRNRPPSIYLRMIGCTLISFGLVGTSAVIYGVYRRSFYSTNRRGKQKQVHRDNNPVHFWIVTSLVALLLAATIGYGVYLILSAEKLSYRESESVTIAVQQLLISFDALSEEEKREAAGEILRWATVNSPDQLADEELLAAAEQIFLTLDAEETAQGAADTRPG